MASSILRAKKVPGIGIRKTEEQEDASEKRAYDCADKGKNPINFGLPRKSPRCAQCLKFKADDPSKVAEDEVEKLVKCSVCRKVQYCSEICQEEKSNAIYFQVGIFLVQILQEKYYSHALSIR